MRKHPKKRLNPLQLRSPRLRNLLRRNQRLRSQLLRKNLWQKSRPLLLKQLRKKLQL